MHGKYSCNYLLKSGKTCGRSCMEPERCHEHKKARKRYPCKYLLISGKICGTPTRADCGLCRLHSRGYHTTQYINRLRVKAKMLEEMEKQKD